ncbi:MAG: DUF2726 domain-containing protein [Pseudomonadota bacterium]|nr:DUF2726 domain-containing protein [Pseudomonadota bacterium]
MSPEGIVLAVLALLGLAILAAALGRGRWYNQYQRLGPLFTPAELRFLAVLERVVDGRARIYGKVRLADLVKVRDGVSGRRFWKAFGFVACKHVDYVLCDPRGHEVLCVIELDDKSHRRRDRRERDQALERIMTAAGIPLLRFPVRGRYRADDIRGRLAAVLPLSG